MFKTSKPRLTEKQHLHSDKMEQMSSLESVKVRCGRGNVICLSVDSPAEFLENWSVCGTVGTGHHVSFLVHRSSDAFTCKM